MAASHTLVVSPLWLLPIWAIVLSVAAVLLAGHELGVQLRRRLVRQADHASSDEGIGGSYLTASLGLLALLVGFSFGMAVTQYNTRRALVSDEANAISTTYRLMQTLDEPYRTRLSGGLVTYVQAREAFSHAQTPDELHSAEARTDALQMRLWPLAVGAVDQGDPSARAVLASIDHMFNLAASRRAAVEAVIPAVILAALLVYAAIAAIFMGYSHPVTRRYFLASTIQFVLLALAFGLIVDLDRPRMSVVEVSQAPLYRAIAAIRAAEAKALLAPSRARGPDETRRPVD